MIFLLLPITSYASMSVSFYNDGTEDVAIVTVDGKALLISNGQNSNANTLLSHLENLKVGQIDLLVSLSLSEEQANTMKSAVATLNVHDVWFPQLQSGSQGFQDLLQAFTDKGIQPVVPTAGSQYDLGSAKVTALAITDTSITVRIDYDKNSFIFTRVGETISDNVLQSSDASFSADVLAVSGPINAASSSILGVVSPIFAVIGNDSSPNGYSSDVLDSFRASGVSILWANPDSNTLISDGTMLHLSGTKAYGLVNKDTVNVRKSASTKASRIASLAKNTAVTITGALKNKSGETWFEIALDKKTGYVRSDLITHITYDEMLQLPKATTKPKVDTVSGGTKKND